ncbi:lantibiotic dehydratase [Actinokineospora bangkokensis]|uniref:Lantibiotic dehydratase n=1 Tax=Actinokineospora bangkokensis TaxID=1193682 RepID=A0A1Q9LM60_9PSEU|nr:lantibiotic dehydratase [Actinokineospora bangkokensis]OLR93110.1 lantibiotic dehydratase [Actinokineospora bangkokensis]
MSDNVELAAGGWRLWNQFALRGPGFPAEGVLALAPDGLAEAADKFDEGTALSGPDWEAFTELFGDAAVATAHELQRIARLPGFRAAVAWQNRQVLTSGIKPFLDWAPTAAGRTSMPRQREELVAHYWQRFCVKNDTIGFFGPVGWGSWDLGTSGVAVDPGEGFIAESTVYFSSWALDGVAKAVEADPAVRAWVPPRRLSYVRRDGETVVLPGRPPQPLVGLAARVFDLSDGLRTTAAIAAEVGTTAEDVEAAVDELVKRRLVVRRIEVPVIAHPERWLRRFLAGIGDAGARERALAKLDAVEAARSRVAAAGRDPEALAAAMAAMEATFAEVTHSSAARAKGARTAPCRSLVYSDTRRSATATLGTAIHSQLEPLGLLLTSARWMTNQVADRVRARLRTAYDAILAERGRVDIAALWFACIPVPHPDTAADVEQVQAELRAKWAELIAAPEGTRRVRLRSADIADRVRELFAEPARGWNIARYISPDLLVVARDAADVERGDFELLVGEMHVAMNTIGASLFVLQHPDQASLLAETDRDFPLPRVMPMLPKELPPRWSARSRPALGRPVDYFVGNVDHTGDPAHDRNVAAADAVVEPRGEELVVVLPDGTEFDVLDVFGNALTNKVMDRFSIRGDADHSPRITIDRVVVARETWRFDAAGVGFTEEKDEARRFVRARWWREELGLPRFAFVVSPAEPRPFFVDFDSPVYVNIMAKAVRRLARKDPGARFTVSEMLPSPEHAWLTDDAGNRYTSELRFVAVDQTTADRTTADRGEQRARP